MQQSTLTLYKRYLIKSHLQLATGFTKPDTRKVTSLVLCVTVATILPKGQPDLTLHASSSVDLCCIHTHTHFNYAVIQGYS